MKKYFTFLISFFFFLIVSSYYQPKVSASILFQDDFNSESTNKWIINGSSGWHISNNKYGILLNPGLSNAIPNDNYWNVNWKNFIYELDIIGIQGVDKNILIRYKDTNNFYEIHHTVGSTIYFDRARPQGNYTLATAYYALDNNVTYHFKIIVNENHFTVFINNKKIFDVTDNFSPMNDGRIGIRAGTGAVSPTEVYFDNIIVRSLDDLEPVILLPGLGASWNYPAMLLGADRPQSEWFMTPGIKVYDGLIESLKNVGYVTGGPNRNLFIFNYDWQKSVPQIVNDLQNYIDNTVKPPAGTRINLVGHSLGGLIARTYFQNNPNAPIGRLLTVGAPHLGTTKAYYLWEGGEIDKFLSGTQRIAAGLVLHLRSKSFVSNAAAVQKTMPVFKDLLPAFDYLILNNQTKPISQMNQTNSWLANLSAYSPALFSSVNTLGGMGSNNTVRYLYASEPDWLSKILGLYPDGKPVSEQNSSGDDTILLFSAHLSGATQTTLPNLTHNDLIQSQTGIQKIMELLGLTPSLISTTSANLNYNRALVVQTDNANLSLTDQNNQPVGFGNSKLLILPNALPGDYQIEITNPTETDYRLYTGQIGEDESLWTTTAGTVTPEEPQTLDLNFNPQAPNPPTGGPQPVLTTKVLLNDLKILVNNSQLSAALKRSTLTSLNEIIRLSGKKDFENAVLSLYKLRQNLDQNYKGKIDEIISNLEVSYLQAKTGIYNQTKLTKELNLAQSLFTQAENQLKKLSPNRQKPEFAALYLKNQEKLNLAKNSVSYLAHIAALGSQSLSQEAIKLYK